MKFVLFVEGYTEQKALKPFLKKWLDGRLERDVGIQLVRFDGWPEMEKDLVKKARLHLDNALRGEVVAVVGLLDLYGPTFNYPASTRSAREKVNWATGKLEREVGDERFRMFFAVHELEAWLFSDPTIFPREVRDAVAAMAEHPEAVDFGDPPAKRLERLYRQKTGREYKKVVHGTNLFSRLDPEVAYTKCPQLKRMLDEMLKMAREFQE